MGPLARNRRDVAVHPRQLERPRLHVLAPPSAPPQAGHPRQVHGSETLFRTWLDTQPCPCKLFFSEFRADPSTQQYAAGGVAIIVTWFTPAQLAQLRPEQRPVFGHDPLAPGRVQQL
eukprot:8070362-Pyramimonas_sp.AAC.1